MTPSETDLFTRDEAVAGLPVRRAQTALFLIESRTAHWASQARQALEPFLTETTAAERDLAFLEAFARGKAPPTRPTIQDLERYASSWRYLVPDNPRVRASLAQLVGQKYNLVAVAVPGVRAALGLDEPAVQAAYERLYGRPLAAIYVARPTPAERLRWALAGVGRWFENLPPFWSVFILTFTQTVGATILALPIALAGVGPIPGIILLVIFGLVNILTIAAQAEAVARSGEMRYGNAFLGRMVETYLGSSGAAIVAVAIAADCIVTLLAFYAGFGSSLADATHLPAGLWAAVLFLVILYFLRRESLSATITSSLVIGAVNLALLAVMAALAFAHAQPENLGYANVPLVRGQPFELGILQVIFGVVLGAYFGHLTVGNCAQLVLRRDPTARSLTWGAAAALAAAIVVYSIWVLAVGGAVSPAVLVGETGTVLGPLAASVGPAINVLGAIYVVLAMAIVSVHFSLSLYNLVRERLPRQSEPVIWLPRRHGRLILKPRGKTGDALSLTYMGLTPGASSAQPRFRVESQQGEQARHVEMTQAAAWDETMLRSQWPELDRRLRFAVTVQAATPEGARLRISTPLVVRYEGVWDTAGLHMSDLLELPADTRRLLTWLMRHGEATAAEVAACLGQDLPAIQITLDELVDQGLVLERATPSATTGDREATCYRAQLGFRRASGLGDDLWAALDAEAPDFKTVTPTNQSPAGSDRATLVNRPHFLARLGPRSRFWLAASPIAIIFLATEILLWTGRASFVGMLSFLGAVIDSLLAGVFPALLLFASRRKGEFVPGRVYRILGQPWLLAAIYFLFIASIFLHGLVIWQDPIQRIAALSVSIFMLVATGILIRRGAFAGRIVVEVCEDLAAGPAMGQGDRSGRFAVTALGQPAAVAVSLSYITGTRECLAATGNLQDLGGLCQAAFDLPGVAARDLKIWAHRVAADGASESLPVVAELRCADVLQSADLRLNRGQAVLPWTGQASQLILRFDRAEVAEPGWKTALAV